METLGRFSLRRGELLRLDMACAIGLHCLRGRLWATTERPGRDYALEAGASALCEGGLILVDGDGELLVTRRDAPRSLAALFDRAFDRIRLLLPDRLPHGEPHA